MKRQRPESVLLLTLDSLRYDTFMRCQPRNLGGVAPVARAAAPGFYTYASHRAMFTGFLPTVVDAPVDYLNSKYQKLFQILPHAHAGTHPRAVFRFLAPNIVRGFRSSGYRTVGTGGVGWFDPHTPAGRGLTEDFDAFYYPGNTHSLESQLHWLGQHLNRTDSPIFAFLNVGETHVPYYHAGAAWSPAENPCLPFSRDNSALLCAERQAACLNHVDDLLGPLLEAFADSCIVACADHGDAWGEDGVWEHGVHHPKVVEVPLAIRVCGRPVSGAG